MKSQDENQPTENQFLKISILKMDLLKPVLENFSGPGAYSNLAHAIQRPSREMTRTMPAMRVSDWGASLATVLPIFPYDSISGKCSGTSFWGRSVTDFTIVLYKSWLNIIDRDHRCQAVLAALQDPYA